MIKRKYKGFKRLFLPAMIIATLSVLMIPEAGAERRRSSSSSSSTSTTSVEQSAPTSSRAARRARRRTVTQETQDAAINASQDRSSSSSSSSSKSTSGQTASKSGSKATSKPSSSSTSKAKKPKKPKPLEKIEVRKPDLEEIRLATLNPKSQFYFPKLMAKYHKNDTTMTREEFRYLYLGYMFQEDYDPYRSSPYSEISDAYRDQTSFSRADIDTIKKYAVKALDDNPFDLRQMSFLVHVLKEGKKTMSASIWEYRLENLLGAIKSTGTGENVDNAWFVIYPMHEYDMIQLLGYRAVDIDYTDEGFDHLLVEPDGTVKHNKPAKGFYFNVLVPQQQYELKHPEVPEEGTADLAAGDDFDSSDE